MTNISDARRESARGNGVAHAGQFGRQTHTAPGAFADASEPQEPAGTVVPIDSLREGDRVDMRQVIEGHIERAEDDLDPEDYDELRAEFAVPQVITEVYVDDGGREFTFDSGTSWHFPATLSEDGLHAAPDYVPAKLEDPTDPAELRALLIYRVMITTRSVQEAQKQLQTTLVDSLRSYSRTVAPEITAIHLKRDEWGDAGEVEIELLSAGGKFIKTEDREELGFLHYLSGDLSARHLADRELRLADRKSEPGEYAIDITPREVRA